MVDSLTLVERGGVGACGDGIAFEREFSCLNLIGTAKTKGRKLLYGLFGI